MTHYQKIMMAIGLAGVLLLGLLVFSTYHPQKRMMLKDSMVHVKQMKEKGQKMENETKSEESSLKNLKTVTFCDKSYKIEGDTLVIDGVDVVERIAQIATANPGDYVCDNIKTNEPGEMLDVSVTTDPDSKDYFIDIRSFFKVSGNTIYSVGGYDGKLTTYGTLK